nr:MgtC/SapB family protein [Streptomyces sp. LS1784]
MHTLTTADFLARTATGVACGALIGVDRQWRSGTAGLRTNVLVAAGATLVVPYGEAVGDVGGEQVVTRLSSEPGVRDLHRHLDDEPEEPGSPALA